STEPDGAVLSYRCSPRAVLRPALASMAEASAYGIPVTLGTATSVAVSVAGNTKSATITYASRNPVVPTTRNAAGAPLRRRSSSAHPPQPRRERAVHAVLVRQHAQPACVEYRGRHHALGRRLEAPRAVLGQEALDLCVVLFGLERAGAVDEQSARAYRAR